MPVTITQGSKRLLLIMSAITLAIVAAGYFHFRNINRSEDPRVIEARSGFAQYDRLMRENQFSQALTLLDTIETIYRRTPGYEDSFELGVIENNRASVYLVLAETEGLAQGNTASDAIQGYLTTAQAHYQAALDQYQNWLQAHQALDRQTIEHKARSGFLRSNPSEFDGLNLNAIITKRADDMFTAVEEMPRRLSVTHTNLGVIARYQGRTDDARKHYRRAMELWPRNHVARNNLNVLLGKPAKEPSLLEKLFPPSRKKH